MKWKAKPRIWLVTRGAQAVCSTDSRALSLQQTPLWGLGRVLALEQPDLLGGLVDLPPIGEIDDAPTWLAEELCREILNSDGEDQVALRKDSSYGVRLSRSWSGALKKRELTVVADATYLVTGGLGKAKAFILLNGSSNKGGGIWCSLVERVYRGRSAWESIGPDTELGKRIAAVRALEKDGAEILDREGRRRRRAGNVGTLEETRAAAVSASRNHPRSWSGKSAELGRDDSERSPQDNASENKRSVAASSTRAVWRQRLPARLFCALLLGSIAVGRARHGSLRRGQSLPGRRSLTIEGREVFPRYVLTGGGGIARGWYLTRRRQFFAVPG